jgi:hypothetical protein
VSPSWRERITITLSPHQVTLARYSRGLRPAVRQRETLTCIERDAREDWQPAPALHAVRAWLNRPVLEAADADLVLSNHFVRYLLIPWEPGLVTQKEELAYARARFLKVFGDTAKHWALKLSRPKPDATGVACAVERTLLEALTTAIANSALRLRSIEPSLMAAFNARSRAPSGDAWLALAEPGRLLLGLLHAGEWQSLRSRPLDGETLALAAIIEQERRLIGVKSTNEKIYLHQIGEPSLDVNGLNVEPWLPDAAAAQAGGAA